MPGKGKSQPGRSNLPPPRQGPGPELIEQRAGNGISHQPACPIGEAREKGFVLDTKVLVRNFSPPTIEINLGRAKQPAFNSRDADRR